MRNIWNIGRDNIQTIVSCVEHCLPKNDRSAVCCFDYFDTLVTRNVQPEHTKVIASHQLSALLGRGSSGEDLYAKRQLLEKELCHKNHTDGFDLEFNLIELGRQLYFDLREKYKLDDYGWDEERFIERFVNLEVVVEKQVQRVCPDALALLKILRQKKYSVVLVSDFYLPQRYFRLILEEKQLLDYFDQIFISADHLLTKGHSGRLYQLVQEQLNCQPENMIMIGDNPHSDIHMACEKGLQTLQIVRHKKNKLHTPEKNYQQVLDQFSAQIPFHGMISSLWLFIHKLFRQFLAERIKNIFFFSKEGELLKALFDQYQADVFGQIIVQSHYILVSRKATFLASLRPLEEESFSRLFDHYQDISLRDFLFSLNFDHQWCEDLCSKLGLPFEQRFHKLCETQEFKQLIASESFQQMYEEVRQRQKENFLHYLDSYGVNYSEQGLACVDVGWKGSIQDNLFFILGGRVKITGFFLGSLIATQLCDQNIKKGLLFDDKSSSSPYFEVYNNNRSLFEIILGASHGSADGYYTTSQWDASADSSKRAIYQSVINQGETIHVASLDLPKERALFENHIAAVQEQIKKGCKALNRCYLECLAKTPDEEWFARQHARMVFTPTKEEIDLFSNIYHLENFGIFEFTNFSSGQNPGWKNRMKNLMLVLRERSILESGIWPPIILNRLGIGLYRHVDGALRMWKSFH